MSRSGISSHFLNEAQWKNGTDWNTLHAHEFPPMLYLCYRDNVRMVLVANMFSSCPCVHPSVVGDCVLKVSEHNIVQTSWGISSNLPILCTWKHKDKSIKF